MNIEDLKRKIRKVLAHTVENGASEAEAHAAIAKAQQMLAAANLDMSDLDEPEFSEIMEEKVQTDTKSLSAIQVTIALALQEHFGVELLRVGFKSGETKLKVVGERIKVQVFCDAFLFAYNTFKSMWSSVVRTLVATTQEKNRMRGDYLRGFCDGLTNELVKQENESALVLVKSEKLKDYMKNFSCGTCSYKTSRSGDYRMYEKGYTDGSYSQRNKNKSLD